MGLKKMKKDILQKFIDNNGDYLIGQRYTKGWKHNPDTWETVFLSPTIDRKLLGKKIGELPFDLVEEFNDSEIRENIFAGKSYNPFQWGIKIGHFICLEKVTCNLNELIHKCYEEDITDYYKVIEVMKSLTKIK